MAWILTHISHHLTAKARNRPTTTSLRSVVMLNVQSSTPARANLLAPRIGEPLTHFRSPRGKKWGLAGRRRVSRRRQGRRGLDLNIPISTAVERPKVAAPTRQLERGAGGVDTGAGGCVDVAHDLLQGLDGLLGRAFDFSEGQVDGAAVGLLQGLLEVRLGEPLADGARGDLGLLGGGPLGSLGEQSKDGALLLGFEGGFFRHSGEKRNKAEVFWPRGSELRLTAGGGSNGAVWG